MNNRIKLLETKFDSFQSFLTGTKKLRTQSVDLMLNALMNMTNNVTQLLLQFYQQHNVLESQIMAQRNAPADIQQLLQANTLTNLQSMMLQQVPSQQPPVLLTSGQVPLFSQPPSTVPPSAMFPTPLQQRIPTMQPPRVSQLVLPTTQPPTTSVVQAFAVATSPVWKPAVLCQISKDGKKIETVKDIKNNLRSFFYVQEHKSEIL